MIHFQSAVPAQIPQLAALWHDTFGDAPAYIAHFYRQWIRRAVILTALDGADTVGMLHLLPLTGCRSGMTETPAYYYYAGAVRPAYRGQGIFSTLLRQADDLGRTQQADLLMVPASPSLFRFYAQRGFRELPYYSTVTAERRPEAPLSVTFSALTPAAYAACRKRYFSALPYSGFWDADALGFAADDLRECGGFAHILTVSGEECAVLGIRQDDTLNLTELAAPEPLRDILFQALLHRFGCSRLHCRVPVRPELPCRCGMILPYGGECPETCWFPLDLL